MSGRRLSGRDALRHLRDRRHSVLLGAIIAAFAVRPLIGDSPAAVVVFGVAIMLLMLAGLYAVSIDERSEDPAEVRRHRRRRLVGWLLAAVAIGERVVAVVVQAQGEYTVATASWLLFFVFVIWSELRAVLRQREVTSETISMSISIYLLLALTWGLLYFLIHLQGPGAFHFAEPLPADAADDRLLPILIYFSLTTISTIGFGDITPVSLQARYAAVAEGIVGQFYLAILVARLVSLQMSRAGGSRSR